MNSAVVPVPGGPGCEVCGLVGHDTDAAAASLVSSSHGDLHLMRSELYRAEAIKAIAEIDAVISDEIMKKLLHKVVQVKLSQEDLGRVLKSLSDISHWFEVDNDLLEIFNDL